LNKDVAGCSPGGQKKVKEISAEACRREANQCRRLAARATSTNDKAQWLHLADEWSKLSEAAEARKPERQ
jgi:hypothetical protein